MIILPILFWVSQGPASSRPLNHCRGYRVNIEINNIFDLNLILHIQRISDCRKEEKTEIFLEKGSSCFQPISSLWLRKKLRVVFSFHRKIKKPEEEYFMTEENSLPFRYYCLSMKWGFSCFFFILTHFLHWLWWPHDHSGVKQLQHLKLYIP